MKKTEIGVYIDQDTIECAQLNARVRKRNQEAEENARIAYENRCKAARAKEKRKAYVRKSIQHIVTHGVVCGAVGLAWMGEIIHPIVCIPVMLYCLCASCVRLGAWLGGKR